MNQQVDKKFGGDWFFEEELEVTLVFDCDGDQVTVYSGNIERFNIETKPYGYDASVSFSAFENDPLDALFAKEKMIQITLSLKSIDPKLKDSSMEFKGVVTDRTYRSVGKGIEKKPLRYYSLSFHDFAKATWSAHNPIKIYVDQSMKEVIDGEKNALISIEYDWETLNETSPIFAFSLENQGDQSETEKLNFYSFFHWYLQKEGGILLYNFKDHKYKVVGEKGEDGDPLKIAEWWISPPSCDFPKPVRSAPRTLKHTAEALESDLEEVETAFQSVHRDFFDSEAYVSFAEQNSQTIKSSPRRENVLVTFSLKKLSETLTLTQLVPGTLFTFNGDKTQGGEWCEDATFKGKKFRIREVNLQANKVSMSVGTQKTKAPFDLDIEVIAEIQEEKYVLRPFFVPPTYPFSILGKVFSEIGEKDQTTFNLVKKEKMPNGSYEVIVPLAGEEKKIPVPFSPDFSPGHHYFPYYKNQQLLLSVYFQTAKVKQVVDFQPLVQLPTGEQGCGTVYASNGKDKYFRQIHVYKDGKNSTFTLERSDTAELMYTILFSDKKISITSEEKGKITAATVLDIEKGISTTYIDKEGGITQESSYNKEAITHFSKGKDGTSTITQKPDSVSIQCKKFQLDCDEAEFNAKKTITKNAKSKVVIDSPLIDHKGTVKLGG